MELNEIRNISEYVDQLEKIDQQLDIIILTFGDFRCVEVVLSDREGRTAFRRLFQHSQGQRIINNMVKELNRERQAIVTKLQDLGVGMGHECIRDDFPTSQDAEEFWTEFAKGLRNERNLERRTAERDCKWSDKEDGPNIVEWNKRQNKLP